MRKSNIASLSVIMLQFLVGIYFYRLLPEQMAIHWNFRGVADGYCSKFLGLFLLPLISVCSSFMFLGIPRIDPLKYNIERFRKHYEGLVFALLLLMLYLDCFVISWNLGLRFSMFQVLAPALGILFYYLGVVMENAKRNWFVGIRTPWTLSNEKVWDKTHRLGGRLFKIIGVLVAILGFVFEQCAVFLILSLVLICVVYTTVYSYFEYRR